MTIASISNGEVGSSIRTKLNDVITYVNAGGSQASTFRPTVTTTIYTLSDADNDLVVLVDTGSECTITVPHGLAEGFECTLFQIGTGQVVISMGASTTKLPTGYDRSAYQGAPVTLLQYSKGTTDYYLLMGALA
jgi:hypothetical protein